jgi:hypothetical protein
MIDSAENTGSMRLRLERYAYTPAGTLGRLFVGDTVLATVERPWLGNRPFESCIPQGHYRCERYSSVRFPDTWQIVAVPERTFILFHVANYPADVEGCVGLGMSQMGDRVAVSNSRKAVEMFRKLTSGYKHLDILISQYMPEYP